eukprot:1612475-Pyramimonas_sp.AAC.1
MTLPVSSATTPARVAFVAGSESVLRLHLPVSSRCANCLISAIAYGNADLDGHGMTFTTPASELNATSIVK